MRRLGFSIHHFWSLWINILVWQSNKQSSKIISRSGLDNLAQQVYYYAILEWIICHIKFISMPCWNVKFVNLTCQLQSSAYAGFWDCAKITVLLENPIIYLIFWKLCYLENCVINKPQKVPLIKDVGNLEGGGVKFQRYLL